MSDAIRNELAQLQKQLIRTVMLGMPGTLMVALALFTELDKSGTPAHPLLNNEGVIMGLFVVGGAVMFWSMMKRIGILKRQQQLRKEING